MRGDFDEEDLEPQRPRRDTELTLGSGTLLAIFFGLVLLCGLCFGLGYAVGHRGAENTAAATPGPATYQPGPSGSTSKPSAGAQPAAATAQAESIQPAGTAKAPGFPGAQTSPADQSQVRPAIAPGAGPAQSGQPNSAANVHPAMGATGLFMVQIAAVSNPEDAEVLTNALLKRGYVVSAKRDPTDNLIHVRVGPFSTAAEANGWKTRLLNDGYNAIVQQ
jgi:cell division septation protein DedD